MIVSLTTFLSLFISCGSSDDKAINDNVDPIVESQSLKQEIDNFKKSIEGEWILRNSDTDNETIVYKHMFIYPNSSIFITDWYEGQVGIDGDPDLPFPTMCSYRTVATNIDIEKKSYWDNEEVIYSIVSPKAVVYLLKESQENEACVEFANRQNLSEGPFAWGFGEITEEGTLMQNGSYHTKVN